MIHFQILIETLETEEQKAAANHIFEKHEKLMYRIAFRYMKNHEEAEDVVMESAANICASIENFMNVPDRSQNALVIRYTKNVATNRYNEKKRKPTAPLEDAYPKDEEVYISDISEIERRLLINEHSFGLLQKYVKRLPQRYKDVLMYRYMDNLSCRTIGKLLNMPESTVSTQVNRALKQLAEMIAENNGEI